MSRLGRRLSGWPALGLALVCGMALGFLLVAGPDVWTPSRSVSVPPSSPGTLSHPAPAPPSAALSPSLSRAAPDATAPPAALTQPTKPAPAPAPEPSVQSAALPPEPPKPEPAPPPPARVQPQTDLPAWRRHAVAAPDRAGRPMIAIVIDDMGVDTRRSAEVTALPGPLTLAFLPYGRDLPRQTRAARERGHELMVHVSMQPQDSVNNPGPNALTTDLSSEEIKRRLDWALAAFDGYVGINNHMGSRFTTDRAGMSVVMSELKARGLLFLDSRTAPYSLGASLAAALDVPHVGRQVFLDNEQTAGEVTQRLAEVETIARRNGLAIAIGHPHDATIAVLKSWLPTLQEKGLVLMPVSAIAATLEARPAAPLSSAMPH